MYLDVDPAWTVWVVLARRLPGELSAEPISGLDMRRRGRYSMRDMHPGGTAETQGGRVLCVVGKGPAPDDARAKAYGAIEKITFKSMAYRRDIGHRVTA